MQTAYLKAPNPRPKLGIGKSAHDDSMCSEGNVVESYSRLGRRCVPFGILLTDQRGEEKSTSRNHIADKAKDVDGEVVDCKAVG